MIPRCGPRLAPTPATEFPALYRGSSIYLVDKMGQDILTIREFQPGTESLTRVQRFAGVPLRAMVGYGFLMHGLAKWHRGPEVFAAVLHSLGVPFPQLMAWATTAFEIVGGLAFLLGAWISAVSIPAVAVLVAAIVTVHLPYGFSSIKLLSVRNGEPQFGPPGYECALLYIACIVALVLIGPGPWSIDARRESRPGGKRGHSSDPLANRTIAHQ